MSPLFLVQRESRLALTVRRCKAQTDKMEMQQMRLLLQRQRLDKSQERLKMARGESERRRFPTRCL